MVVDNRVSHRTVGVNCGVEAVDLLGREALDRDVLGFEVSLNPTVNHVVVAVVGVDLKVLLRGVQPRDHILKHRNVGWRAFPPLDFLREFRLEAVDHLP